MIKSRDLLAGLFVVFGIVLLMFAVAWSDKLTTWFDSRRELTLLLPRGVPIEIGQAVRMEGIRVGEVTGYRIRDDAARRQSHPERHLELVLRVDPALAIGRNTEIQLTGDGLLALATSSCAPPPKSSSHSPKERRCWGSSAGSTTCSRGCAR
jgi:ABC-type transporter Mla subunit MlaD